MKSLLNVLKYLLLLGVGVVLFSLVFGDIKGTWNRFVAELPFLHYGFLTVAFVIAIVSHLSRAIRWNLLINGLGYNVKIVNSFMAVMIGYFANLALPRMGEVSRCLILNRTDRVPADKLIGTVIVERAVDLICLLLILMLTLILEFNTLRNFLYENVGKKMEASGFYDYFTMVNFLAAASIFIVLLVLAFWFFRQLKSNKFILKITGMLKGLIDGVQAIKTLEKPWLFVFHSVFIWFLYYLMMFFTLKAYGATTNLSGLAALSVFVMGSFGFVVPVQGGIGAYHAAVIQALLMYGIGTEQSEVFAFLSHTFQVLTFIVIGGISFIIVTLFYKKLKVDEPQSAAAEENP